MPLFKLLTGAIGAFFLHYQENMGSLSDKGINLDEKTEDAFPVFHKIWIALCVLGVALAVWIIFEEITDGLLAGVLSFLVPFPAFLIYTLGVMAYYLVTKAYIFVRHRR